MDATPRRGTSGVSQKLRPDKRETFSSRVRAATKPSASTGLVDRFNVFKTFELIERDSSAMGDMMVDVRYHPAESAGICMPRTSVKQPGMVLPTRGPDVYIPQGE